MQKLLLGLPFIVFSASLAFADAPPLWRDGFFIRSENGKYQAQVQTAEAAQDWPAQTTQRYVLTVIEVKDGQKLPLWSGDYRYDGYADGLLSDDGSTFVYVNFWYYPDAPVVTIYRDGTVRELPGKDFRIEPAKIQETASHELWLKDGDAYRFIGGDGPTLGLEIVTIDGKRHVVDMATGKISDS